MARVGEFVRDNASLGEIRKFERNLKWRVRASYGEFRSQSRPAAAVLGLANTPRTNKVLQRLRRKSLLDSGTS